MFSYSREHNRRIAKTNWKMIVSFMSYKSKVKLLNPKNSTKRCSRCGKINAPKGASYTCSRCGLRINRQLNAAVNLYLQIVVFSKFEALRGAYEDLEWVHPDRGGG